MVTSTLSLVAFAAFNMCTSAVEKRLLQAEDSLAPTSSPSTECGIELSHRKLMPECQLMNGDRDSCERAYVQYTDIFTDDSRSWAEPCAFYDQEGGVCLPFPPCMTEGIWGTVDGNATDVTTVAPSVAPTVSPTTECGLEMQSRTKMPACQDMHGDKKSCEGAYVRFTVGSYTWAEPCFFWEQEGGVCLPFPPCYTEDTWDLVEEEATDSTVVPTVAPSVSPTTECGLELSLRKEMPACQDMHGDKESCEGAYVRFTMGRVINGPSTYRAWSEPCFYWNQEGGVCLPFPPCYGDDTWDLLTSAPSALETVSPTRTPTAKPTFLPTMKPSMKPSVAQTGVPTLSPTWKKMVCAGKKKGKCRNTRHCRYVSKKKGCQVRITPCSFMKKKNQCVNSFGCDWMKKRKVCEDTNEQ